MNQSYFESLLEVIRNESIEKDTKFFREVEDTKNLQEKRAIEVSIPDKKRAYVRGSEIGDCIRKLYFRLKGVTPDPVDPNKVYPYLEIAADIGNVIHEKILSNKEIYKLNEYSFNYESSKLPIHGRIDGITHNGIIVELKTIDDINRKDIPKQEHISQLAIYTHIAREIIKDFKIQGAELKYVSRGKINVKSFSFSVKQMEEIARILISKLVDLSNHLKSNTVPSLKNEFINSKQCKFCEYKSTCKKLKF